MTAVLRALIARSRAAYRERLKHADECDSCRYGDFDADGCETALELRATWRDARTLALEARDARTA